MKTLELKDGIYWVGMQDPNLRIFDIIMETEFGTSYNSYVVKGNDKIALFETVKIKYFDEYVENLKAIIGDLTKIDYLVVNHTEPDHSGSVAKLLEYAPNAKVVGTTAAIKFLCAIANTPFESITVNTGDTLDLGGKTLEFIFAPFLHWPDSMYTYIKESKTLITCDSFGSHYSTEDILLSKLDNRDDYMKALRYYFTMIMGPFKNHMLSAIKKIENLDIDLIGTGHGPVLDENPMEIVEICRQWSIEESPNTAKTVVIPYVSAYGFTEKLANEIAKGVMASGDVKIEMFDMVYADFNEVMDKIRWADGILLGSPTINSDALPPIWNIVMAMSPIVHGRKLASAFGSYGWSGEAVPYLTDRLKQLRMKIVPGYKVQFNPSTDELKEAYAFGEDFGDRLLGKNAPVVVKPTNVPKKAKEEGAPKTEIKKWKCVICNEVFDGVSAPDICPACGASHEQFEEYIEEKITFKSDYDGNILIVGNSAAGVSAIEGIRERNTNAKITVLSADNVIGYYRPMLSDYISDTHDKDNFFLHDEAWYKEMNVNIILNCKVTGIDDSKKLVISEDGKNYSYDKLILANGSRSNIPPVSDVNKTGVFAVKTLEDAKNVRNYAKNVKSVAIVGGGLLGLEAAAELSDMGLNVSVVEGFDRLLPRQLDHAASELLEKSLSDAGIEINKNFFASGILGDERVEGLQLVNGDIIECDMVILSSGIVPNTELAKEIGLVTGRGVVVNEYMETSKADIYAAGDVAEYNGVNYGLWSVAIDQGKVAGARSVGDEITSKIACPSAIFTTLGINLFSIGNVGGFEKDNVKAIIDTDPSENVYKKFYFIDGKIVGGFLYGDVSKSLHIVNAVSDGLSIQEVIETLY